MRVKKILVIFLTVLVIVSTFTITVFAADSYGSKQTIDMRWDAAFHCIAPTDTTYYYYYIVSGKSGAFNFIGNDYVLIWSRDRLIVENNSIQFTSPFYYVSASKIETLLDGLATDRSSLTVYSSSKFVFNDSSEFKVHYSNQKYVIDGKTYAAHWPSAITGMDTYALTSFLQSIYVGLKNAKITVFGTEISAWVMLAGPFLISFTVSILQKILGVGDAAAVYSVSAGRNIKNKIQKNKEERERQGK